MKKFLAIYLLTTGAGAALAVLVPGLVIAGMFLIVPGLILIAMPTLFLYGVVFAIGALPVSRFAGTVPASIVGLLACGVVGWGVPTYFNTRDETQMRGLMTNDIEPPESVGLGGTFGIVARSDSGLQACDMLCAALLLDPAINAVVRGGAVGQRGEPLQPMRFTRGGRPCDPKAMPAVSALDQWAGWKGDEIARIVAAWRLNAARGECIERTEADAPGSTTLNFEEMPRDERPGAWALSGGVADWRRFSVVYDEVAFGRKTAVAFRPLRKPLFVDGSGDLQNFHLHWARHRGSANIEVVPLLRAWTPLKLEPPA